MHSITARDALSYAISQQLARLYAVIIAGWILVSLGLQVQTGLSGVLEVIVAYPLLLAGVVALYGGTIALLFKIVTDANAVATMIVREP